MPKADRVKNLAVHFFHDTIL